MTTFSEVVDAVDKLSLDEQETLVDLLHRRIADRNRAALVRDVKQAQEEFAQGLAKKSSVADIMDEAGREP